MNDCTSKSHQWDNTVIFIAGTFLKSMFFALEKCFVESACEYNGSVFYLTQTGINIGKITSWHTHISASLPAGVLCDRLRGWNNIGKRCQIVEKVKMVGFISSIQSTRITTAFLKIHWLLPWRISHSLSMQHVSKAAVFSVAVGYRAIRRIILPRNTRGSINCSGQ